MKFFYLLIMEIGFYSVLFGSFWAVEKLKSIIVYTVEKAKEDKKLRNDIFSCIYFIRDMGSNVSAYSIVAIFVATQDSISQLFAVFIAGILIKRIGRRLARKFAIMTGEEQC